MLCLREALLNFCRSIDTDIYASTNESTILPSRLGSDGMDRPRALRRFYVRDTLPAMHLFMAKRVATMKGDLVDYKGGTWTAQKDTVWILRKLTPKILRILATSELYHLKICDRNCNCRDTSERSF